MKQNKLVIVVLVIIAVLFVLGLNSGVFRDKDEQDDELNMSKAMNLKNDWGAVLSPFKKNLDSQRLPQPPKLADCQIGDPSSQTYRLTAKRQNCDIIIAAKKGADVENAILAVKTSQVKVMVPYPDNKPCVPAQQDSQARGSLSKLKTSKAITGVGKVKPVRPLIPVKPGKVKAGEGSSQQPQQLELSVIYIPAGKKKKNARCEVTEDVDLAILKEGGTLRLECKGCEGNRKVTVAIK